MICPRLDRIQKFLLTLLLSAPSIACYAYSETDLFSDIPEIVSATRIPQDISEVPVSTTVITQELIEASGAVDIAELFKLVPGFQVYTPNANKYAVTYHGASGEYPSNLDVRINGRPVYIPLLSAVTWNTLGISISDIQRIEVVRGSNVPSYGSNALMGAINIITKTPIDQTSKKITATMGAQGRKNITTSFNGKANDLYYRVSLGHEQNSGFDFQQDGENVKLGNIHLIFTPSLYDSVDFIAGFNNGVMTIGYGDDIRAFQDRDHFSHFQHLQWSHVFNDKHELNTQLYHNYLKLSTQSHLVSELLAQQKDPISLQNINTLLSTYKKILTLEGKPYPLHADTVSDFSAVTSGENGSTHTYGAEIQHTLSPIDSFTLASGIGLRYEQARSMALLGSDKTIDEETYFIFSNGEWKQTDKLSWNAGFMSEFSSITKPANSIRLASNYKLSEALTIRAATTQAYRTPSLLEENGKTAYIFPEGIAYDYDSFPNDTIGSEKLKATELELLWKLPEYNGYIDLKLFHEKITNGLNSWFYEGPIDLPYIQAYVEDRISGGSKNIERNDSFELRNASTRRTHGFEIQASFKSSTKDLIHFAYSLSEISGIKNRGNFKDRDLTFNDTAPRHTATLLLNRQISPTMDASLVFNYMSEVKWFDTKFKQNVKTTGIKISKLFPISYNKYLTTSLLVKNVFDQQYSEFQKPNIYDRRLYLTLTLDF